MRFYEANTNTSDVKKNILEMAMTDYLIRERLPELRRQIDNTHLSYLETDDSPEKLDQRKKLEGYISDYLFLVPHENKFCLRETGELLSRSALLPDFSGYRLARGWVALARYASNLLVQPWRKEYRTIRLYSGYYKHEVEGSGLADAGDMLRAMGYRQDGAGYSLTLDGPVCPDQVTAVSRDSLIAYVECQIMIQIWEEVSRRGGSCSWLEVLRCREEYSGDVDQAATIILYSQRNPKDVYSNVKFSGSSSQSIKNNLTHPTTQMNDFMLHQNYQIPTNNQPVHGQHLNAHCIQPSNGYIQNGHGMTGNTLPVKAHLHGNNHVMAMNNHGDAHNLYCSNPIVQAPHPNQMNGIQRGPLEVNPMYRFNNIGMMNQCGPLPGYYYNPMPPHPYMLQPPLTAYGAVRQATTLPLANGYHCPTIPQQTYCPSVPTGQLIELDIPTYPVTNHSHHVCPSMSSPKQSVNPDRKRMSNGQLYKDYPSNFQHSSSMDSKNNTTHLTSHNTMKKSNDASFENQDNIRRNSAPRSSVSYSDHTFSIPRSDTQPSLSKAREDGMGTFESWDYVFRNLESQGYSKDLGERGNILSPPLERDSKTLGRVGSKDPKKYQQTTMDLEDGLQAISLEKDSDEEVYRTAKINETLLKIKQDNEAKAAKAHSKRQILADEREKLKSNSYESTSPVKDPVLHLKVTDRTRLISKEDAKEKKEMDKNIYINGNNTKSADIRKVKRSIVKCLSSETDVRKKASADHPAQTVSKLTRQTQHAQASTSLSNHQVRPPAQGFDNIDGSLKTRLVVTLRDQERSPANRTVSEHNGTRSSEQKGSRDLEHQGVKASDYQGMKTSEQGTRNKREVGAELWGCGTCTFFNNPAKNACEICGKSRQVGAEALPLTSGGKECPKCTLVNKRDATVCMVCETDLKHSPTYI